MNRGDRHCGIRLRELVNRAGDVAGGGNERPHEDRDDRVAGFGVGKR
jgi:hypothetical protein